MRRAGIGGKAFVLPDNVMTVSRSPAVMMRLLRVRRAITGVIYNSGISGETKQLINILLTGDTSDMDPELRAQFSGAGLAHVLALSGLHVGIIASLLIILLYPLRLCRRQSAAGVITILLLWAYAAVTGMSASVTRAVVMASVLLMASMLQRRHSPANALCLAAMLIVAFDPMALFTVSFQLSFAAVAGILLFARSLNPVSPRRRISHRLAAMLTVTISAMLATGTVAAYYFHTFPVYFLIANVAAAPLLPLLVSGAICATILEACHCSVGWLNHTVDLLASGVTGIADLCSRLPGATVTGIYFSPWLLIGVAATVAALAYGIHRRRIAGLIASALCAAITFAMGMLSTPPDRNGIYFLPASDYTCMAVATAHDVTLISNARDRMLREISLRETPRLRDYMSRRGITSPTTANRRADVPGVIFRYPLIHIGNSYIILADDDDLRIALPEARPAYVIVCNGYRGTMADLADRYAPDTIVISTDLNPRRAARYLRECDDIGLPAYTMRSGRLPDLNALLRPVNPASHSSSR